MNQWFSDEDELADGRSFFRTDNSMNVEMNGVQRTLNVRLMRSERSQLLTVFLV
jgi:hypothetical protein